MFRRFFIILSIAAIAGCGGESSSGDAGEQSSKAAEPTPVPLVESSSSPPNIVLIVMDTVRRDHLSIYGHDRPTTPHLQELMKECRAYQRHYSTSSWTLPSHASMFTGLYPVAHGATGENPILAEEHETLAEILRAAGYQTIGIAANPMLEKSKKFDQGFDEYFEPWREEYDSGESLFEGNFDPHNEIDPRFRWKVDQNAYFLFKKWLTAYNNERPAFVFVNLVGPHSPYNSSGPFYNRFISDSTQNVETDYWPLVYAGLRTMQEDELKHLRELYDAEILHTDFIVGKMVEALREKGIWNDTYFIVTSDHGEHFGERGHMSHLFSLHQPLVYLPLLVHGPKYFAPGSVDELPSQLNDLFPTILNLAGIGTNGRRNQGVDLRDFETRKTRPLFLEMYKQVEAMKWILPGTPPENLEKVKTLERRLRCVIRGDYKLIWGEDGAHELYNVALDPSESNDLFENPDYYDTRESLLFELQYLLDDHSKAAVAGEIAPVAETDPEAVEALRALGYVK